MEWLSYVWVLVPIAGIVAWGAIGVTKAAKGGGAAKAELESLRQRVDAVDTRLAAVEKTLNDIP